MKNLADRLKAEATGLFIEADSDMGFSPEFGIEGFDPAMHIYLCVPDQNYSRWSLSYLRLPGPFKPLVAGKEQPKELDKLYVFHYPIDMKRVGRMLAERRADRMEFYDFIRTNNPGLPEEELEKRVLASYGPDINPNDYYGKMTMKYGNPSSIYMTLISQVMLVGNNELMAEVMGELKKGSEEPFTLMKLLLPEESHIWLQDNLERVRHVDLYDLIGKPKEVHHLRQI
jgi:hypothetical protein